MQAVHHADLVAEVDQLVHDVAADEAGAAGDEDPHARQPHSAAGRASTGSGLQGGDSPRGGLAAGARVPPSS
jgi:hypothetical protein